MFPFWKTVIAPAIRASGARRIVEIGALRGENTALMLDDLPADAELHVIDPVPAFDPEEHRARFGGRYVFHEALSLDVLGSIGAFDAALIDGDHNWYTVYNELRALRETARKAGAPLPLCFLHDVGWPYGRRDLYYAPATIPKEFRQPHAQRGMHPGRPGLGRGGMNAAMHNAKEEGGPRNGVMTAVDDFVAEDPDGLRMLVLPAYFGLAILADRRMLAERPELGAFLDHLESPAGKDEVAELAESVRITGAIFEQNVFAHHDRMIGRGVRRYLDLLKAALADQLQVEDRARLASALDGATDAAAQRDPRTMLPKLVERLDRRAVHGVDTDPEAAPATGVLAPGGRARLDHLEAAADQVRTGGVPGDLVDVGVGPGGTSVLLRGWLEAHELEDRRVWVVDPFKVDGDHDADLNTVRSGFARHGLLDDAVRFASGPFATAAGSIDAEQVALLRLGPDLSTADARAVVQALAPRMAPGAVVVAEGAGALAAAGDRAVELVDRDMGRWTVSGTSSRPSPGPSPGKPPRAQATLDLTVVVVLHDMRREAARTLHSLSRAYQRGVDDLAYEVLVVDNGSSPDQKLTEQEVAANGAEFRLLDMGPDAPPTPIPALNAGIRAGHGHNFALMIDGAHVLTPGVLRHGMTGLAAYAPAVVATVQWYVGPGQQPDAVAEGYDQSSEDRLFEAIEWPVDGYRLFEIGHFIGDGSRERDWLDGILESNCIFTSREALDQIGGFDEAFSMPGGGYANLDIYERLAVAPGTTVVTILGEGSFHQVHGGTTTNAPDPEGRRAELARYGRHYEELRGRSIKGPTTPIHHVGSWVVPVARRTRPRRMTAEAFRGQVRNGPDGRPERSTPVPDELAASALEAYWASLDWQRTSWLGLPVDSAPGDLVAYQELLAEVAPDWIVDVGTGSGARARFLASLCDLFDRGRVVTVAERIPADRPEHPRIEWVTAKPHQPDGFEAVRAVTGPDPRALVILGERTRQRRTVAAFEGYHGLVPVGSYVVVESTVVNGHPVWTGFGPGPQEAVTEIVATHPEFAVDRSRERGLVSLNRGGYLRRNR
jgi:cephalosporin hydroxylase